MLALRSVLRFAGEDYTNLLDGVQENLEQDGKSTK